MFSDSRRIRVFAMKPEKLKRGAEDVRNARKGRGSTLYSAIVGSMTRELPGEN